MESVGLFPLSEDSISYLTDPNMWRLITNLGLSSSLYSMDMHFILAVDIHIPKTLRSEWHFNVSLFMHLKENWNWEIESHPESLLQYMHIAQL
jgi:hypothetical protein